MEKKHHISDSPMLLPGRADGRQFFIGNAGHLGEAFDLLLKDL
ncbi:hypothetical protein H206_06151 [Candidatus Electrothrix aarhusensis]|uniref:Uncharacterized protein n=1 Tax=Candidatus Electrothrix aarhusensis TaxID=1859131 RepID=A0A444J3A7_9BACT|nr:hypothetical protein H206_06151 [Candidatus Electrothrix aarhusensis]